MQETTQTTLYVTYSVAQQQRGGRQSIFPHQEGRNSLGGVENQAVQDFLKHHEGARAIESFVELPDYRRTAKWPQLQKAIEACKRQSATLLILELGTLASNEGFSQSLLETNVKFHCMDQPFVDRNILEALSKHAQVQRKLHGKLIREGLKMTNAKSGNPNAAEVISKVNKPKIDTAIVFAFLLQPIIQDYRRKGFSQRQMVKMLNDEGFTAPEGGKWVLSQLQKVLDRVRLNEIATEIKPLMETLSNETKSAQELADVLNAKGIQSLKRGPWDDSQVKKLLDCIEQIEDVVQINRFVLNLLPVLKEFKRRQLNPWEMLKELHQAGLPIRQTSLAAA